jgi:GlpG protein
LGAVLLMLCLLLWATVSNLSQLLYVGNPLFGGLSGVVSAMFGARWVMGFLRPYDAALYLPRPLVVSILFSLIVFSTGISALMGVSVANTAHWSGLIIGLITGGILHLALPGGPSKNTGSH